MQRKPFHHSLDDPLLGRGIGQKPFFQAAEKSQKLRYDDVDHWIIPFTELAQSRAFDSLVTTSDRGIRDVFTDNHLKQSEPLSIQFVQQIQFVGAYRAIARQQADHHRVVLYAAHWSVSKTKVRFADRGYAAGRQLQPFQRGLAR